MNGSKIKEIIISYFNKQLTKFFYAHFSKITIN